MKANLFAIFCLALLALSLPQTFAQDEAAAAEINTPIAQETTGETLAPETPVSASEEEKSTTEAPVVVESTTEEQQDSSNIVPEDTETAKKTEEVAEETEAETPAEVAQVPTTEETQEEVSTPSEGQQEATEAKTEETEVAAPVSEEQNQNTTPVAPETETPENTEEKQESAVATTEENTEPAPAASEESKGNEDAEEEEKEGAGFLAILSKVLVGALILAAILLVVSVYHYRFQMRKYKIAPFTPPSFLPECLFPRNTGTSAYLVSGYTELQVGNYQAAPRFAEV